MELIEFSFTNTPKLNEKIVLCLGFFDGVHLGHQAIINAAKKEGYKVGVLTFDNSPSVVLGKIAFNEAITSPADKADLFEELGVDYLLLLHFDLDASKRTKDEFINLILSPLNPVKIYCGEDYRFGVRGEGNPTYLKNFFPVEIFPLQLQNGMKISSSDIAKAIQSGDIEHASSLLGRYYRLSGLVIQGKHNGQALNFPTANLSLDYYYVHPKIGVYVGYAYPHGEKHKCLINVGTHPTIMPLLEPIIEVHILDYDGNLYGLHLFVDFVKYVRPEYRFQSTDELKKQLQKDLEKAKKCLP
ncbi:MAG: riboflavin biosynthesis protein RibF [Bacilli bacterium]|jgi:riboflavin kinase/FMN adenylyltransferase|nr:riboflavin biosynthesis protein RibF [Bacilli bacterium]MDD3068991.1 riboflavin biosynthesis protein RibF [Bacilli bacterium]MDD3841728.1 riboflavin biosynthesis protein RibF [Bacilli bacterium]HKM10572.1 riboflavin biosynthesis protein RibF [Bacilli bacterium]